MGKAWRVGREPGENAGCFSGKEDLVSIAQIGQEDKERSVHWLELLE